MHLSTYLINMLSFLVGESSEGRCRLNFELMSKCSIKNKSQKLLAAKYSFRLG